MSTLVEIWQLGTRGDRCELKEDIYNRDYQYGNILKMDQNADPPS
jgi:hypothetical protein